MNRLVLNSITIISFLLYALVVVILIDPANSIFKVKDAFFLLLVSFSAIHYSRINLNALLVIVIIYIIVVISFIAGFMSVYQFDYAFTISVLKGFSPLFLLLWIDKFEIVNKLLFPSLVISLLIIVTFLAYLYFPSFFEKVYNYSKTHDNTMIISRRTLLGYNIIMLFYKSLPVLILPASIYTYRYFKNIGNSVKNFVIMSILLGSLLLGGTRASILAGISILSINILFWISRFKTGKLFLIPVFIGFIFAFGLLVFSLISEKDESSNKVKYAHLDSYSDLFVQHPSILIVGQGAGSLFYSKGKNKMIVQTEWTYIEFIRMFGIIGATVVVFIFLFPLYLIYKKRELLKFWLPITLGYVLYLFVGGTNPLLLGSSGMLVLLTAYSYALNPFYEVS